MGSSAGAEALGHVMYGRYRYRYRRVDARGRRRNGGGGGWARAVAERAHPSRTDRTRSGSRSRSWTRLWTSTRFEAAAVLAAAVTKVRLAASMDAGRCEGVVDGPDSCLSSASTREWGSRLTLAYPTPLDLGSFRALGTSGRVLGDPDREGNDTKLPPERESCTFCMRRYMCLGVVAVV